MNTIKPLAHFIADLIATAIDKQKDACAFWYQIWKCTKLSILSAKLWSEKSIDFAASALCVCVWGIIYQTNFHTLYKKGRARGAIKMHHTRPVISI
jgi:hypothetical protein